MLSGFVFENFQDTNLNSITNTNENLDKIYNQNGTNTSNMKKNRWRILNW